MGEELDQKLILKSVKEKVCKDSHNDSNVSVDNKKESLISLPKQEKSNEVEIKPVKKELKMPLYVVR